MRWQAQRFKQSCSADCAETSIFEPEANVRSSCRHCSELQRRQRSNTHLQTRVEGTRLLPTNIASSSANSATSSSTRGKGTNVLPTNVASSSADSAAMHFHLQVLTRGKDTKLLLTNVARCRCSNGCLRRLVPHLAISSRPCSGAANAAWAKWLYMCLETLCLSAHISKHCDGKCADRRSVPKHWREFRWQAHRF